MTTCRRTVPGMHEIRLKGDTKGAVEAFLARYSGGTRDLYELDLRVWLDWCAGVGLKPLKARRANFEEFSRHLIEKRGNGARSASRRLQTIRTFYRLAVADDLIPKDPTLMMKMPKWEVDRASIAFLDKGQVARLLRSAETMSPNHHALIALMCMLGLRVSEACSINVEDLEEDPLGYMVVAVTRKGGKRSRMPIPVPLLRVVNRCLDGRKSGPLIRRKSGCRQSRHGAYDWFKRTAKAAGLPEDCHPHTLRHASISALVDAGATLQEAQEFAGHSDIRTTAHYFHRNATLDQHGSHITARVFASA